MTEEKEVSGKTYSMSEEVAAVARKVIVEKHMDHLVNVGIGYMLVGENINDRTAGRCIKAGRELKFFSGFDFIIQMSQDIWEKLNDEVKFILTYHELKHIGVKEKDDGSVTYYLVDHDVQDFSDIINEHGIGWLQLLKDTVASVRDADGKEDFDPNTIRL